MRLTAKERILIHLADFATFANAVEVPPDMGQDGIARAAGIRVQHVRQFVDPLLKEGSVRERTAHVKGHRRRLRVYELTESGRIAAARLREQVRGERVRVHDATGTRELTIGDLFRETKGRVPLGTIVGATIDGRTIDLTTPEPGAPTGYTERLSEEPRLGKFVGRQAELDLLTSAGGPRFVVVRGIAGIGKTSLAAKACERLRGTANLFWHRIRPWDTRETILADLGEFLASMGRPGLRAVLARGEIARADEALRADLAGTKSFLVFDDAHEAATEVLAFLRFLKDTLAVAPAVRVLVSTRKALPSYDRRDVAVSGLVREIDLGGLGLPAVGELLSEDGAAHRMLPLAERLGGHPLFLELLRSSGRADVRDGALRDVRRFIEEEIYGTLSDAERRMMKLASLYEVPVPREALFADESLGHDVLLSLQDRALLRQMGDETLGAHDTIRDFFAAALTPVERRRLAAFAVEQLRRIAREHQSRREWVASIDDLSNALRLADEEAVQANLWESLGDANEAIGDLPGTLTAYGSARKKARGVEEQARLHRKVAMALQNRGENAAALTEVEAGLAALDGRASVEAGWLELVRCRIAVDLEEFAEALEHGSRSLQAFRILDHSQGMAQALLELGRLEIDRDGGQSEQARTYLQDALARAPATGGEDFAARAHMEMARNLAWRALDIDGAMREVAAAEALLAGSPNLLLLRSLLMLKGRLSLDFLADLEAARGHYNEAVALGRRVHSRDTIAFARFRLAHVLFWEGRAAEARAEFEALAAEIQDLGYPIFALEAWWRVAECSMWLGDLPGFRAALSHLRSPEMERAAQSRPWHAAVLRGLDLYLHGDRENAIATLQDTARAAGRLRVVDETVPVYFTEIYVASALSASGRDAEAAEHVRRAEEFLRDHYKAWLSVLAEQCRRFSDFLRAATAPPA